MAKDPNTLRLPRGRSLQFQQGWRASEAGKTLAENPYQTPGGTYATEWAAGFEARADIGFETAHLPRRPHSDAFAF